MENECYFEGEDDVVTEENQELFNESNNLRKNVCILKLFESL